MEFLEQSFDAYLENSGALAFVLRGDEAEAALDRRLSGQIAKLRVADAFEKKGEWIKLPAPTEINADSIWLAEPHASDEALAERKLGAALASVAKGKVTLWGGDLEMGFGFALRAYQFAHYKTEQKPLPELALVVADKSAAQKDYAPYAAKVEGVHLTRDLVNEPANVLNTIEFANRIKALSELGVEVEILDEAELKAIGMEMLLAVGQGSEQPSKVAIMKWQKGEGDPLLLAGKGVVFDTGGISLKPASGMEDMTMDMGGGATVVGTMHSLAKRGAKANVIGIVGLVENMPSGEAIRPGDIVKSLKGDSVEVINTDAEGRLVLGDILWYGQQQFKPRAVIDLATLTGAILVALGHENAGVFSNDDGLRDDFLAAAKAEGEGAWPMPIGAAYDKLLKSKHADMGNIGGRFAGAITAAQFLLRFIEEDMPWIHLDIAGVAERKEATDFAPAGASGWGVLALDHLIQAKFEG